MAFKTFAPGVLTSSDVNTFLMRQAVITCTSSTRPASPSEGMTIFETDTDRTLIYDGSAWLLVAYPGAWRSYAATLISGGSGTDWVLGNGTISANYARQGNAVTVQFQIVMGSTTTFGTKFLALSLPFNTTWTTNDRGAGFALAKDVSLGNTFNIDVAVVGNFASFAAVATNDGRGNFATWDEVDSTTPFTWASTDRLEGIFTYEAA
jgi:hypothetical protein